MNLLARTITQIKEQNNEGIDSMRLRLSSSFPYNFQAFKKIDIELTRPLRRKGFNLVTWEGKKGKRIYARLSFNGKTLPTKFNTYADNEKEAELYILKNKERLIDGYLARKDGRMYKILEGFYEEKQDNLSERCRKEYRAIIANKFIPFLRKEKIKEFAQITKYTLMQFQDVLGTGFETEKKIFKPVCPQSVNNNFKAVRRIFDQLERRKIILDNPCDLVKGKSVSEKDKKPRGCYEIERLNCVFSREWKDKLSYLLSSLIYTTGMRNCEIKRLKLDDIKTIDGCRFISIKQSKTVNGIRLAPLHKSMYMKLKMWVEKNNKTASQNLFDLHYEKFNRANNELARRLKVSDEELERENITFYSGRHFWKTLMSAEGLGEDIEEVWMGHKVSGNVAKLYNHRDKHGKKKMVEKAKEVFSILDRSILNTKP